MRYNIRASALCIILSLLMNTCVLGTAAENDADKVLFREEFPGNAQSDFMQDERNLSGNEYFNTGFIVEGTTRQWPSNRFVIEPCEFSDGLKNMIRKTYQASTQQRPTRNLREECRIKMAEDAEYYISYSFKIGETDDFAVMEDNQATNFDALMIDINSRTGCGIAKDPSGKIVPFVSFYKMGTHISYGTKEIEKGVLYHALLRIEAYSDVAEADVMSMAVYPDGEEFSGTYDVSHSFATSAVYQRLSYHFRASLCENDVSGMMLGNVKAWQADNEEPEIPVPEPGNGSDESVRGPGTVVYEDFNYTEGTLLENAPALNAAEADKGFGGGWLSGTSANVAEGDVLRNAAFDGRGGITISADNTKNNLRKLSEGMELKKGHVYYITWTQKSVIPPAVGTYSQKLELGTADGTKNTLMFGLVKLNGTEELLSIIRINGADTQYGKEKLDLSKEYTMVARVDLTSEKETMYLSAYERGTRPPDNWGCSLSGAVSGNTIERLSFQGNFSGAKNFGNLIIDKVTAEEDSQAQTAAQAIADAENTLAEADYRAAEAMVEELNDGILKRENKKRFTYLTEKYNFETENVQQAEQIILGLENTEFKPENTEQLQSDIGNADRFISQVNNPEKKAELEARLLDLRRKLEFIETAACAFVDEFSGENGTLLADAAWKSDKELSTPAGSSMKLNGSGFKAEGVFAVYHDIAKTDNDNLYITLDISENTGTGFAGVNLGDYCIGLEGKKLQIKNQSEIISETEAVGSGGKLFIRADGESIEAYLMDGEAYSSVRASGNAKVSAVGLVGEEKSDITFDRICAEGISDNMIAETASAAVALCEKNIYTDILKLNENISKLPDTSIKSSYNRLAEIFLEMNKKIVPEIQSVSVKGNHSRGAVVEAVYIINDVGGNAAEPVIQWNGQTGEKSFRIPSSSGRLSLTVIPVNVFGEKGVGKTANLSLSAASSGGGGSGGSGGGRIAGSVKQPEPDVPQEEPRKYAFLDLQNHWAEEEINDLAKRKIVHGVENEFFCPDDTVTRAQFAKMAGSLLDESGTLISFSDVSAQAWYYADVQKAAAAGIMQGDGNKFWPEENITREEIAVTALRLFEHLNGKSESKAPSEFSDREQISSWAVDSVLKCTSMKLMSGMDDGTFKPGNSATRAEAAVVIWRIVKSL